MAIIIELIYVLFISKAQSSGYNSTDEELGDGGDAHGDLTRNRARLRARSEEFLDRANKDDRRGVR